VKTLRKMIHDAVCWGSPTPDGFGRHTFGTPTNNKVRWQDTQELFIDDTGSEVLSVAVVFLTCDIDLGAYLWKGTTSSSAYVADPQQLSGAYPVRRKERIWNIKGTQYITKVYLR